MIRKIALLAVLAMLLSAGCAFAEDSAAVGKVGGRSHLLFPSSWPMVDSLSEAAGPEKVAALIRHTTYSAFGFSSGASEESGSFKLGILMADLQAAVGAGDSAKALEECDTLAKGLIDLGAPEEMLIAVRNLRAVIYNNLKTTAIHEIALPVLRPFIEGFVAREGKSLYFRLGEWVEIMAFITGLAEAGKQDVAERYVHTGVLASQFAEELEKAGAPKRVFPLLDELHSFGKREKPTGGDYKAARNAADELKRLF